MINRGSEWHRWEPHIHAPGTIMNNQFAGSNAWGDYLTALEQATPVIEAIAVTDYYVTDTYEEMLRHKAAGRLPAIKLIFPNVELRLDVATSKGGFVNLHLFVSPEDPQHVEELQRLLSRLQFNAMKDRFDCTRADLIRLGKKVDPAIIDDQAALTYGANQFKVNFQKLREVFSESEWAKQNILIAVAGGATDGTSGVREAADQTIRREIESFAHVIFASSPAQREFWLGQRDLAPDEVRARYSGLKPCLHGSDAHKLDDVASPFGDRFSWIKGGLEFDALRQACIDPEGRAYAGELPPQSAMPSQVVSSIKIDNADWANTPDISLNPGLVAIIGARGSGKTALADVIAAGCDAIVPSGWNADENVSPSFLARARGLIGSATTTLTWGGGENVTRSLDGSDANSHMSFPRARYLSQQFVEELCSEKGASDGLVAEIERVIFEAHSQDECNGAIDFAELRDQNIARFQQSREREAKAISDLSEHISTELEKESLVTTLTAQGAAERRKILQDERDDTYGRIFEAITSEQNALADLYTPLMARLAMASGTLKKLGFSVHRVADLEVWGSFAEEELLDRRKAGLFYGRGSLIKAATEALKSAWENGSAIEVQAAMKAFMDEHIQNMLKHAPYASTQQAEYRAWLQKFAQWLFSTEHISVGYQISYDGVDIRKLSPGTRGIVLLLLYLALDDKDDRPLIIDQPEENLDPKSVFDELVSLFIEAKRKRQVIMVTHNANLVINTDADQIIVAEAGPHPAGGLPPISYMAGGLENATIRKSVCDILEGGDVAFRERARRLRVRLER